MDDNLDRAASSCVARLWFAGTTLCALLVGSCLVIGAWIVRQICLPPINGIPAVRMLAFGIVILLTAVACHRHRAAGRTGRGVFLARIAFWLSLLGLPVLMIGANMSDALRHRPTATAQDVPCWIEEPSGRTRAESWGWAPDAPGDAVASLIQVWQRR